MSDSRRHVHLLAALAALALVLASCGADSVVTDPSATDTVGATDAPNATVAPDVGSDDDPAAASTEVGHPIVRFAASGPGQPNTFGPSCAVGVTSTSSNQFRLTAPATWELRGSGGGSGTSEMTFVVGDSEVLIDMAGTVQEATSFLGDLAIGAVVAQADLGGIAEPIVEVTRDGAATGYALQDVVYLSGLPQQFGGEAAMTIVVSSTDPGVPTLADATAVLSSIRVERCSAIQEAVVAMSARGVLAVPEFENDPLGKSYPGGDQPAFDMAGAVDAWSLDQLAYLLPFPEPIDRCVAEALKAELPEAFPLGFLVIGAVQGEQQDALFAIADGC